MQPQHLIFTMDVQFLYTCIPHKDGLKAIPFYLSHRPTLSPSTDTLIHLAELVLAFNNFSFDFSLFLQTKRLAMGTRMGPGYTCFFVGFMEQSIFNNYTGIIPHLFLCYIDDCISVALCSHEELKQFINFANTFQRTLKVTVSDTSLPFLDLFVSIS
eukprot:g25280.t1